MPKGSAELTSARKEEIVNACEALYETMSFKEITMKEIANATSFTRTSIYNYFQTKEEIFLALLAREYERWADEIDAITAAHETMNVDELADKIARSLDKRIQLLKLVSMNHYDMEENSREERLTEFKTSYGRAKESVRACVQKFVPGMTDGDLQSFIYSFFPFMFGIYPYTFVNERQRKAKEEADVEYTYMTAYEIVCNCVKKLLKA